jgi:hypothetical protein
VAIRSGKQPLSFNIFLGNLTTVKLLVKDPCGNIQTYIWNLPQNLIPYLGPINLDNYTCSTFSAFAWDMQNLTTPSICLYNAAGVSIKCDSSGRFDSLAYGSYCIKVHDGCIDTTLTRCFTATRPVPSVGPIVDLSNFTCTTFTGAINGQVHLYKPLYCLYNSLGVQIRCDSTGIFDSVPYGTYCIKVINGCYDTVINRCFIATRPFPLLTEITASGYGCNKFNIQVDGTGLINPVYCMYDSSGALITCDSSGRFDSLAYGNYCVRAITQCGDTTTSLCFSGTPPVPEVGPVITSNLTCTGFLATVTGQAPDQSSVLPVQQP